MYRLHPLILILLISTVGCTASAPRGIAWGFKKRPRPDLAEKTEREDKARPSKIAMGKPFRKKSSPDKQDLPSGADRENDRELAVEDLLNRARDFDDRNDLKEAEKLYKQVLEQDRDNSVAIRRLANIADLQNRFRDAEEYYNRGLALRPDDPELLNDLGYSYSLQERYEESEETLRKALSIKPDHVYAMNNLGYLLAKRAQQTNDSRDYQVALEIFQKANGHEAAQQTIQELFPNGPPQTLAQTSSQAADPFAARPVAPPSSRNPFEPNQPHLTPQQQGNNAQIPNGPTPASTNPFLSNQDAIVPASATPPQASNPMQSSDRSSPSRSNAPANPVGTQGFNQPQAQHNSINITPANPESPPNITPAIQPNGQNSAQAPQQEQFSQQQTPQQQTHQQQIWNTTPSNGGGSESALWENAQRSAAQLSLNAMFPVADASGRPVPSPQNGVVGGNQSLHPGQDSNPGMSVPNPSTGWTNTGNNPLDRTFDSNPATGNHPSNTTNQMPPQNAGGWQNQPGNGSRGLPAPNPFADPPASPSNSPGQTPPGQRTEGIRQPGGPNFGSTNGNIKPIGATATDIELFEAELLNEPGQNASTSSHAGAATRPPSTGSATATY